MCLAALVIEPMASAAGGPPAPIRRGVHRHLRFTTCCE
jgi:hypothetical protein